MEYILVAICVLGFFYSVGSNKLKQDTSLLRREILDLCEAIEESMECYEIASNTVNDAILEFGLGNLPEVFLKRSNQMKEVSKELLGVKKDVRTIKENALDEYSGTITSDYLIDAKARLQKALKHMQKSESSAIQSTEDISGWIELQFLTTDEDSIFEGE